MNKPRFMMDLAKENSEWHFDESIQECSFRSVCIFQGDWHDELKECIQKIDNKGGFSTISLGSYSGRGVHTQEEEMEAWGYKKEQVFVDCASNPEGFSAASRMATDSGLLEPIVELLRLRPGYMLPWHCDMHNTYREQTNATKPVVRYLVALDDWKWGHYVSVGNSVWHQWSKGECITWPYLMYHAAANCGNQSLLFLTITGQVCDQSVHLGSPRKIKMGTE